MHIVFRGTLATRLEVVSCSTETDFEFRVTDIFITELHEGTRYNFIFGGLELNPQGITHIAQSSRHKVSLCHEAFLEDATV